MSGFAGMVRLDGAPIDPACIDRLAAAIAHRGRDKTGTWSERSAILVHAALHTTPESVTETQPQLESGIVVAADARLDDRERLATELRVDASVGDASLIAAAYKRWGKNCARHLEGDFAFAILDGTTVVLGRDTFGVKPLVYCHIPGRLFAFASTVSALLTIDEIPRTVDEKRIADFLTVYFDDVDRTFFAAIKRLPGACTLTLTDGSIAIERWWSPDEIARERRGSDEEFAEGFRHHFVRAVRNAMRAPRPLDIGAMLSGGLDSSAIVCVARDELGGLLPVFSWIFSDAPDADEREFQTAVANAGGVTRYTIDSADSGFSPWSDLDRLIADGPPYAPNHYLNLGVGKRAHSLGLRVVLDGLGGDSTISRGGPRFVELLVRGRIATLTRELREYARVNGESAARLFQSRVISPLTPPAFRDALKRVVGRRRASDARRLLRPRLSALVAATQKQRYEPYLSVRAEQIDHLRSPMLAEGLELTDRVMAIAGVEGRYPFFDKRLIEYCVSLPSEQKLRHGYTRVVARNAMRGIMPDEVRWRAGKGKPGLHMIKALRDSTARIEEVFRDPSPLAPYADIDAVLALHREFAAGRKTDVFTAVQLWSAISATLWLKRL
jgi:asparagine synthase (glutamine-hydrolysing)